MDPQKALDTWLVAAVGGDHEVAEMHAAALREWLARGGFRPKAEPIIWDVFETYCREMGEKTNALDALDEVTAGPCHNRCMDDEDDRQALLDTFARRMGLR